MNIISRPDSPVQCKNSRRRKIHRLQCDGQLAGAAVQKERTVSSLVRARNNLPEVYFVKETLSDWACARDRLRRYTTTPSETRTVQATLSQLQRAPTATVTAKSTTRTVSAPNF